MRITTGVILVALASLTGCASIVNGQNQSVSVETRTESGPISGAHCSLTNNKGTWYVTTPGSTTVNRSYEDLAVRCGKASLEPGLASVKSSTKAMAFGNILFGGIIGAGVDISTGAAYDYPTLITVMMGGNPVPAGAGANPVPTSPSSPAAAMTTVSRSAAPAALTIGPAPLAPSPVTKFEAIDSPNAERVARQSACNVQTHATLIAKGPGYETYSVKCEGGDALVVRCEFGNCRVLK